MSDANCPFCTLIGKGEARLTGDRLVRRIAPLNPVAPGHMLFVPTVHYRRAGDRPLLTGKVFEVASEWASDATRAGGDYNLITSAGAHATQTVWHMHVHYVPRRVKDGLHLPWTGQQRPEAPAPTPSVPSATYATVETRHPIGIVQYRWECAHHPRRMRGSWLDSKTEAETRRLAHDVGYHRVVMQDPERLAGGGRAMVASVLGGLIDEMQMREAQASVALDRDQTHVVD